MKRNNKGYISVLEIAIVIVIIGLLAAMAIPAFIKVEESSILKRGDSGQTLNASDSAIYFRLNEGRKNELNSSHVFGKDPEPEKTLERPAVIQNPAMFQNITVDGKTFLLLPKTYDMRETNIAGQTFFLVPVSK